VDEVRFIMTHAVHHQANNLIWKRDQFDVCFLISVDPFNQRLHVQCERSTVNTSLIGIGIGRLQMGTPPSSQFEPA